MTKTENRYPASVTASRFPTGRRWLRVRLTKKDLPGSQAVTMPATFTRRWRNDRACDWPMLAIGFTTRFGGLDATMGLAFASTGRLFPFFSPLLGWLGVALTGSDTSSNVLFGSLQKVTAQRLGLDPSLMAAANSSGGVMGKMIDAQSIVVASTATRWYGHEGEILRYVFFHSIALAVLVGLLVMAQAYVAPFTHLVPPTPAAVVAPAG